MGKYPRNSPCWCGSNKKYKKCCYPEISPDSDVIIRHIPPNSEGTQPIRVLENNIIKFFEHTNKNFLDQLEYDVNNKELKAGIGYINEESKLRGTFAYINSNKQIYIQETFLSYLWIISYCLVQIFDEHIQMPRLNRNYHNNPVKLNTKFEFLKYGLSIINYYSDWDIERFPNPYKYKFQDKISIEKTNSVFLHAVNYALCHEYSHFSLGHVDKTIELLGESKEKEISPEQNKEDEISADYNAIKLMLKTPRTKKIKKNIEYGIVVGVSSLVFLDKIGCKNNYPDPEIRLKNALYSLKLKPKDLHWGLACLTLKLWTDFQKEKLDLPEIVDTYKDCFDLMITEIEKIK